MISLAWEGDWPVTQPFGVNPQMYQPDFPGHEGIDIGIPTGVHVRTLWSSEVIEVGLNEGFYGYYVKLREVGGFQELLYAHLLPYHLPAPGETIEAGQRCAMTGASGRIFGVHLHVGYRADFRRRALPWKGWSDPYAVLAGSVAHGD